MSSAPPPYTSLSENTDAVLKLNLGERGTRRVAFRKLWDSDSSNVSYQRLADLAVHYSILSDQHKNKHKLLFTGKNATVNITYVDEDGDTILISSDDELAEAFHQFLTKTPPVRVVRANGDVTGLHPSRVKVLAKTLHVSSAVQPRILVNTASNTDTEKDVDSITGVSKTPKTVPSHPPSTRGPSFNQQPVVHPSRPCQAFSTVSVPVPNKAAAPEDTPATMNAFSSRTITVPALLDSPPPSPKPAAAPASTPPKLKHEIPASVSPNFIHGRHTCDGCYATPIIGYRYNATNLQDYDLCQKCFDHYMGSDIIFVADQLQRDEHLQQRWKSRYLRQKRQVRAKDVPKGPSRTRDASKRHLVATRTYQPCVVPSKTPVPDEVEKLLKVERVLKGKTAADFEAASDELNTLLDTKNACPKKVDEALRTYEEIQRDLFRGETLHSNPPSKGSVNSSTDHANFNATIQTNNHENVCDFSGVARPSFPSVDRPPCPFVKKVRDSGKVDEDQVPSPSLKKYVEKVMENLSEELRLEVDVTATAATALMKGAAAEKQVVSNMLGHLTEELKASLRSSSPTESATTKTKAAKVDAETETNTETEEVGDESVKTNLEKKKDKEVKPQAAETERVRPASNEPEIVIEPTIELPIDTLVVDTMMPQPESQLPSIASRGEMIIDGDDDDEVVGEDNETGSILSHCDEKSQRSTSSGNSSWEVVAGNNAVTDEMMAQAAQMLGSALFQSDINVASNEDVDTSTSTSTPVISDSVCSLFTSIPTITDRSEISSVVLERWEDELHQLHELGFLDDRANVCAFGHLEAANMGVGCYDRVTVAHAVDYLLKKK